MKIRRLPDWSGSWLIKIRLQPDWSGYCLIKFRQLPDWSDRYLIKIRQTPDRSGSHHGKSGGCLIDQDPGLWEVYSSMTVTEFVSSLYGLFLQTRRNPKVLFLKSFVMEVSFSAWQGNIVSVLWREERYTVKYSQSPFPRAQALFHRISRLES